MNIFLLLEMVAAMHPDRVAVGGSHTSRTYQSLLSLAPSWAAQFAAFATGRPIAYLATNRPDLLTVLFGCAIAGVPLVPLNYRLRADEIRSLVDAANPALILIEDRYLELVSGLDRQSCEIISLDRFHPPEEPFEAQSIPSEPAVLLFTSGTTSIPKLVELTHANLIHYVLNTAEAGSAEASESQLIAVPPYHIAAIASILTCVFRGRRIVIQSQFDPMDWLKIVRTESITHAMVVPTMLSRILDVLTAHPELQPSSLVNLAYGGSKATPGLVERALALLSERTGLVNAFGLTETTSTVSVLSPEDHRASVASSDPAVRARLYSAGRLIPGIELRIVREDGNVAGPGEEGEIWLRGPQVSLGYRSNERRINATDWLQTRDRGFLDSDSYLFITGRADDLIIRGGEKILPNEIEEVLIEHPAITDAAVVGTPDPEWGQVVSALVVGDRSVSEEELRSWVRSRLAGYKTPVNIRWATILPRNDMGKVLRREVRSIFEHPGLGRANDTVSTPPIK